MFMIVTNIGEGQVQVRSFIPSSYTASEGDDEKWKKKH